MAKILDKDPISFKKERDGFIRDLHHFHETKGTPFRRCPTLGGQEVDLYLLYSLVTAQGGWMKVNSRNEWEDIFEQFNFPSKCVNSGVALKQIYLRYLDRYEKVHFLGEEHERGSDDDEESRHKRWSARALHSVPLTYNYQQHNIADSIRAYNGLSDNLYKASDYDRLALSLISPLPNEQDFAVNVCTLLCNEGKHTLKLEKCPRLIDFLLGHTGVYNHESLRTLFTEVYTTVRNHSLSSFWYDALEKSDWWDLINEKNFPIKRPVSLPIITPPKKNLKTDTVKEGDSTKMCAGESVIIEESDCELFASEPTETITKVKLKLEPHDRELFCSGLTLGTQDFVGQRVLQIAQILRNLSFQDDNVPTLAKNRTFLRFLLLCVGSRWNSIHQLGLDMLSNIASEISVKDQKDRLIECLLSFVTNGLCSEDRTVIIACLEILNKLSQRETNEDYLLRILEQKTYAQVCSFLTLHDVMLLIYTLECLYSLSSLGEKACNYIVEVHGIIDTLVSLVTVEGKSYGPKACIGMKLVETVSGVPNATSTTTTLQSTQPAQVTPVTSAVTTPARTLSTPTLLRTIQTTPQKSIVTTVITPTVTPVITTLQSTPTATTQSIQQAHAHQQAIQENEQFALAYLRATYEPCVNGKIEQQELYKQYLNSCAKIGRRGVIAPLHFPRCVRSVFGGTVGPNPIKGTNDSSQYYDGIKTRPVPLIINFQSTIIQPPTTPVKSTTPAVRRQLTKQLTVAPSPTPQTAPADSSSVEVVPPSPASPILKAQLSAPPKPKESPTKVDVKSQVLAHPHLSQALLGNNPTANASTSKESMSTTGQSNTSLIKSLLATKVTDCMSTALGMKISALAPATNQDSQSPIVAQVAQRQQQQRLLAQQNQTPVQTFTGVNKKNLPKPQPSKGEKGKVSRVNGARLDNESSETVSSTSQFLENHISSSTIISGSNSAFKGKREPPQPPPPPLAPLSGMIPRSKTPRMDMEDSDSTGNNSVASSTGISCSNVGISSTEDGENSLTSFEGILQNGIPNSIDIDAPLINEDSSNSKDSIRNNNTTTVMKKPLMLADLLEKKVDKDPPVLNGLVGKELRIGEKGLELVDNHISKILLSKENNSPNCDNKEVSVIVSSEDTRTSEHNSVSDSVIKDDSMDTSDVKLGVKRPADDDISEVDIKRPTIGSSVIVTNGNISADSPKPESVGSSNGDEGEKVSVSATAANLYAALAADALEDEDEELLQQETTTLIPATPVIEDSSQTVQMQVQAPVQMFVSGQTDSSQQLMITPRQIIVTQAQIQQQQQVIITAGGQLTLQQGTTSAGGGIKTGPQTLPVIVQTGTGQQRPTPMILSQSGGTPILVSQGPQGQVQLVTSGSQPGQYVLSTGGAQGQTHYMVAQPQTALVQGQTQTVLVAQTPQQQGTGSKTIIILQPQSAPNQPTHHQKVVVTPQGQQVVVTQVQRPILQQPSVSNNNIPALVSTSQTVIQNSNNSVIKTTQNTMHTNNVQQVSATIVNNNSPAKLTNNQIKVERVSRPGTPVTPNMDGNNGKTVAIASTSQLSPTPQRDYTNPYICEWRGCTSTRKFKSANEVYMHACEAHCPYGSEEIQCLWDRCDSMKRKRFSLMTHLLDRHCSNDIMKMMHMRRKQLSQSGRSEIPAPTPPPPHPGYAPDAAIHAIKRHALEFVNPKELQKKPGATVVAAPIKPVPEQDDNEGPVTKSIRLTASLILRNLVIFSNNSKRYLRQYEPHLAGVALSNVESSRTIAQLLYDLNENTNRR